MSRIDVFIEKMFERSAEHLVLVSGQPSRLYRAGESATGPTISSDDLRVIIDNAIPPDSRQQWHDEEEVNFDYLVKGYPPVTLTVERFQKFDRLSASTSSSLVCWFCKGRLPSHYYLITLSGKSSVYTETYYTDQPTWEFLRCEICRERHGSRNYNILLAYLCLAIGVVISGGIISLLVTKEIDVNAFILGGFCASPLAVSVFLYGCYRIGINLEVLESGTMPSGWVKESPRMGKILAKVRGLFSALRFIDSEKDLWDDED